MTGLPDLDTPSAQEHHDDVDEMAPGDNPSPEQPRRRYEPHPIAQCWPSMSGPDFARLCESLRELGLLQPIVLYEGMLLDGRHRQRGCEVTGVTPRYIEYTGHDPVGYAVGVNETRRFLGASQRSIVAGMLATLGRGGDGRNQHGRVAQDCATLTQTEAAQKLGVSRRAVQMARKVLNDAPELAEQVAAGKLSISAATRTLEGTKSEPKQPRSAQVAPAVESEQPTCSTPSVAVVTPSALTPGTAKWRELMPRFAIDGFKSICTNLEPMRPCVRDFDAHGVAVFNDHQRRFLDAAMDAYDAMVQAEKAASASAELSDADQLILAMGMSLG